jgi:hypothetical protein
MKKTITIDDNLQEIIKRAESKTEHFLREYVEQNPNKVKQNGKLIAPDIDQDLDYDGSIHQIVDQCVPVYHKEIKDLWYLYGEQFESAYEDAGVGNKDQENWQSVAIYFYLYQELRKWYDKNAESITKKTYHKLQNEKIGKQLTEKGSSNTLDIDNM